MKWFAEGDRNTKFFHPYVKGRRKKLHLAQITNSQGVTVHTNHEIRKEVVTFFKEQFREEEISQDWSML